MAARVRFMTMAVILAAWAAYVGATIWRGGQPDPLIWGVPAGAYAALFQPWRATPPRRDSSDEDTS